MLGSLRQSMAWLHNWAGLLFGWLLYAVFMTGALSVVAAEITHWMTPEFLSVRPADRTHTLHIAQDWLEKHAPPTAQSWQVELPWARHPALLVAWHQDGQSETAWLDPASGQTISPRDTEGGEFLIEFHYSLHAGLPGILLVGLASIVMLIALCSGLIVHRRLFVDFFTFRPNASTGRAWLDAHNVLGVLPLPFYLMITITALSTLLLTYLPSGINSRYDGNAAAFVAQAFPVPPPLRASSQRATTQSLATSVTRAENYIGHDRTASVWVHQPGQMNSRVDVLRHYDDRLMAFPDRVSLDGRTGQILQIADQYRASLIVMRVMGGLHYGRYAGAVLRGLYFVLGVAGAAMIATGLLLFTLRRTVRPTRFERAASRINVAMIAGPLYACAGYFLANRLCWPQSPGLHEREVTLFFALWALSAAHAAFRQPNRLWREQWSGLTALVLAIPLIDIATLFTQGRLQDALVTPVFPGMWIGCLSVAAICGWTAQRAAT
ncbi:PepSY-associated TM helix domain-containing protein [Bordetella tumulicola]|uniref:PepSY-associated TM helix domain-containing protein n=1 Tax=Bordetella tumulicola TaxID=1649133 RepID=UPI0039EE30BA